MAYSHCTGQGPGQIQGMGLMGPNILNRNVHTGPGQGQEPDPLSIHCASPVPCTCPGPVQCECPI